MLRARVALEMEDELVVQGVQGTVGRPGLGRAFRPGGLGLTYLLTDKTPDPVRDQGSWKEQELRKNVVWLGAATSERFIPQMLGLDNIGAVSFSKGCYPGQEVIARARYLGKVKRKPLLLQVFGAPELVPGESLGLGVGEHRLEGAVVDSVALPGTDQAGAVLAFVVAPVPERPIESVAYAGFDYRCATI